ncbi:3-methyl-2-oxobutanoate hydroxymethyltransferase [Bradyrhizobium japonicum]|uniref:3-methyl-2-oxobutanoate hydroxymethyltransferase n=1 Tax=Bradyrhizobium japonicum TaxID=375 RepID=UPI0009040314
MEAKRRIVLSTACDAVTARIADPIVEIILIGDSVGNVCPGFEAFAGQHGNHGNSRLEAVVRCLAHCRYALS